MTYRKFISIIKKDGWILVRKNNAAFTYRKAGFKDPVVIHCHAGGRDIPKGTLKSYERITGLKLS